MWCVENLENKKIAWVRWEEVCARKERGGLGVKNILLFNGALLGKWGEIFSIMREVCIRDGVKTRFWLDKCLDGQSLAIMFPRLFLLADQKEALVKDMWRHRQNSWGWDIILRRNGFVWEQELIQQLYLVLENRYIQLSVPDLRVWKYSDTGTYTTKSAYSLLSLEANVQEPKETFLQLSRVRIPSKASYLIWKLLRNRLATKDNLRRRNVISQNDLLCPLCKLAEESTVHLFSSCQVVSLISKRVYSWRSPGFAAVLPLSIDELFLQNSGMGSSKRQVELWQVLWGAVIFCVWRKRNAAIFKQEVVTGKT